MDITLAMRIFVTVAESGSLVAAAYRLDMSTTAVSRHIKALETHLGARLLHRTTRRLSLSGPGQAFLERAQQILESVAEAEALIGENVLKPSGHLRISAPHSYGARVLAPLLPAFSQRHPQLGLDIELSDRRVDLVHDRVDVALRIAKDIDPQLVARKIAPIRMIACASPAYLDRRGAPASPLDLIHHETLSYSYLTLGDTWTFIDGSGSKTQVRIRAKVRANTGEVLRDFSLAGAGITVYPSFIVDEDIARGNLTPVLSDWTVGDYNLYAVYLSSNYLAAKVRVFIDYMLETVAEKTKPPTPSLAASKPQTD